MPRMASKRRATNPNKHSVGNQSFTQDGQPVPSIELAQIVHEMVGNKVILSFSGKDSLAMWLWLREQGFETIPYFCYTIPDLSFDREMLTYYQDFFGVRIYNLPHPLLYTLLRRGAFQMPDTWRLLSAMQLPEYDWADIEALIASENNLGDEYFSAVGIRAADNMMRNRLVHQMGPLGFKNRRYWWAIWDWKIADVMGTIRKYSVKLPRAYSIWGSTGDSVDYNAIRFLKDAYPDDYQRFLNLFPLADIELFRYEAVK